jgi:hypothetical protein
VELRFDEFEHGLEWAPEGERLARTSHAVVARDRVWLTDVVDGPGLDERIGALGSGSHAAVIQLLDRHSRDNAAVAERLGVPLHVTPFSKVEGAPFVVLPIVTWRFWREIALWFAEERILVCADALGSLGYFRGRDEPFGVHPFLRLFPPTQLGRLEPEHVLFGHGRGFHGPNAQQALREAFAKPRRRLPLALLNGLRGARRR